MQKFKKKAATRLTRPAVRFRKDAATMPTPTVEETKPSGPFDQVASRVGTGGHGAIVSRGPNQPWSEKNSLSKPRVKVEKVENGAAQAKATEKAVNKFLKSDANVGARAAVAAGRAVDDSKGGTFKPVKTEICLTNRAFHLDMEIPKEEYDIDAFLVDNSPVSPLEIHQLVSEEEITPEETLLHPSQNTTQTTVQHPLNHFCVSKVEPVQAEDVSHPTGNFAQTTVQHPLNPLCLSKVEPVREEAVSHPTGNFTQTTVQHPLNQLCVSKVEPVREEAVSHPTENFIPTTVQHARNQFCVSKVEPVREEAVSHPTENFTQTTVQYPLIQLYVSKVGPVREEAVSHPTENFTQTTVQHPLNQLCVSKVEPVREEAVSHPTENFTQTTVQHPLNQLCVSKVEPVREEAVLHPTENFTRTTVQHARNQFCVSKVEPVREEAILQPTENFTKTTVQHARNQFCVSKVEPVRQEAVLHPTENFTQTTVQHPRNCERPDVFGNSWLSHAPKSQKRRTVYPRRITGLLEDMIPQEMLKSELEEEIKYPDILMFGPPPSTIQHSSPQEPEEFIPAILNFGPPLSAIQYSSPQQPEQVIPDILKFGASVSRIQHSSPQQPEQLFPDIPKFGAPLSTIQHSSPQQPQLLIPDILQFGAPLSTIQHSSRQQPEQLIQGFHCVSPQLGSEGAKHPSQANDCNDGEASAEEIDARLDATAEKILRFLNAVGAENPALSAVEDMSVITPVEETLDSLSEETTIPALPSPGDLSHSENSVPLHEDAPKNQCRNPDGQEGNKHGHPGEDSDHGHYRGEEYQADPSLSQKEQRGLTAQHQSRGCEEYQQVQFSTQHHEEMHQTQFPGNLHATHYEEYRSETSTHYIFGGCYSEMLTSDESYPPPGDQEDLSHHFDNLLPLGVNETNDTAELPDFPNGFIDTNSNDTAALPVLPNGFIETNDVTAALPVLPNGFIQHDANLVIQGGEFSDESEVSDLYSHIWESEEIASWTAVNSNPQLQTGSGHDHVVPLFSEVPCTEVHQKTVTMPGEDAALFRFDPAPATLSAAGGFVGTPDSKLVSNNELPKVQQLKHVVYHPRFHLYDVGRQPQRPFRHHGKLHSHQATRFMPLPPVNSSLPCATSSSTAPGHAQDAHQNVDVSALMHGFSSVPLQSVQCRKHSMRFCPNGHPIPFPTDLHNLAPSVPLFASPNAVQEINNHGREKRPDTHPFHLGAGTHVLHGSTSKLSSHCNSTRIFSAQNGVNDEGRLPAGVPGHQDASKGKSTGMYFTQGNTKPICKSAIAYGFTNACDSLYPPNLTMDIIEKFKLSDFPMWTDWKHEVEEMEVLFGEGISFSTLEALQEPPHVKHVVNEGITLSDSFNWDIFAALLKGEADVMSCLVPPPTDTPDSLKKRKEIYQAHVDEIDDWYIDFRSTLQYMNQIFDTSVKYPISKGYTQYPAYEVSRRLRRNRDGFVQQLKDVKKELGEPPKVSGLNSRIRAKRSAENPAHQEKMCNNMQMGSLNSAGWRPQRGLPDLAVASLKAWLFGNFLHPYPKDNEKAHLAKETGLTRGQVSNWFINARVRVWKPMIEDMYQQEFSNGAVIQVDIQIPVVVSTSVKAEVVAQVVMKPLIMKPPLANPCGSPPKKRQCIDPSSSLPRPEQNGGSCVVPPQVAGVRPILPIPPQTSISRPACILPPNIPNIPILPPNVPILPPLAKVCVVSPPQKRQCRPPSILPPNLPILPPNLLNPNVAVVLPPQTLDSSVACTVNPTEQTEHQMEQPSSFREASSSNGTARLRAFAPQSREVLARFLRASALRTILSEAQDLKTLDPRLFTFLVRESQFVPQLGLIPRNEELEQMVLPSGTAAEPQNATHPLMSMANAVPEEAGNQNSISKVLSPEELVIIRKGKRPLDEML